MQGTNTLVAPVVSHPGLPGGVPLVADFTDDRNRLSYYHPMLKQIEGVRTPLTLFVDVEGSYDTYPEVEYREVTRFMQAIGARKAFVRGDYSSGKLGGERGSKIESQDPYDIEGVTIEMMRQLARTKRHLGGRVAFREWIPHDTEVRFFIRDGEAVHWDSDDEPDGEEPEPPRGAAQEVTRVFTHFAWSVDFIRHEQTGKWYCTDMGLDGLYHNGSEWIAISEHRETGLSPERHADEMPAPGAFRGP